MIRYGLWSKGFASLIESESRQFLVQLKHNDPNKYPNNVKIHTVAENWADVVKCGIEYPADILNNRRGIIEFNKRIGE